MEISKLKNSLKYGISIAGDRPTIFIQKRNFYRTVLKEALENLIALWGSFKTKATLNNIMKGFYLGRRKASVRVELGHETQSVQYTCP